MADQKPSVYVEFYVAPKENKRRTAEEHRPVFEDVEMVKIRWVGDNKRELHAPAHSVCGADRSVGVGGRQITYAEKYAEHYARFREGRQASIDGTPIDFVAWLSPSARETMRAIGILTLEGLAGLADRDLSKLGLSGREWRDRARAEIEDTDRGAAAAKLMQENRALSDRLAEMERMMAELHGTAPQPAQDAAPADAIDAWEKETCIAWLTERGVPVDRRQGAEKLREAVRAMMAEAEAA